MSNRLDVALEPVWTSDHSVCLVVRLQPLRESDVIVTLIGSTVGRLDVLARGARSSRRRFAGSLRLFACIHAELGTGRGSLPLLVQAQVQHAWLDQCVDYAKLAAASYASELALATCQPGHGDPALVLWLQQAWTACDALRAGQLRALRLQLEVSFLRVHGSLPDLSRCSRCNVLLQQARWPDWHGGLMCTDCSGGAGSLLEADLLQALLALDFAQIAGHRLVPIEQRVGQLLGHSLTVPLKSVKALTSLIAFDGT